MDTTNSQSFWDYINGTSYALDGNTNADATSPVITAANGTSQPSTGLLGFLSGLISTAAPVATGYLTAQNTQKTQNQLAATNATATAGMTKLLLIGGAVLAVVFGGFMLLRRKN